METFLRRSIFALCIAGACLWIFGCASAPKTPRRFVAPDTTPIKKAIAETQTHITTAKDKAAALAAECASKSAGWQSAYDALQAELSNAYLSAQTAENARADIDSKYQKQIDVANWYAQAYATDQKEISELKQSRHGWVMQAWYARIAAGVLLAWICRKPLFAAGKLLIKWIPVAVAGI